MTHICVSKLVIIGSDNGLSPVRRKVIIWTNAEILLNEPIWTNFSEISIEIHRKCTFKKMHLKMSSAKWRPFCLGLNVIRLDGWTVSLFFCTFISLFIIFYKKLLSDWTFNSKLYQTQRIIIRLSPKFNNRPPQSWKQLDRCFSNFDIAVNFLKRRVLTWLTGPCRTRQWIYDWVPPQQYRWIGTRLQ